LAKDALGADEVIKNHDNTDTRVWGLYGDGEEKAREHFEKLSKGSEVENKPGGRKVFTVDTEDGKRTVTFRTEQSDEDAAATIDIVDKNKRDNVDNREKVRYYDD
jgi:hypothetical protein